MPQHEPSSMTTQFPLRPSTRDFSAPPHSSAPAPLPSTYCPRTYREREAVGHLERLAHIQTEELARHDSGISGLLLAVFGNLQQRQSLQLHYAQRRLFVVFLGYVCKTHWRSGGRHDDADLGWTAQVPAADVHLDFFSAPRPCAPQRMRSSLERCSRTQASMMLCMALDHCRPAAARVVPAVPPRSLVTCARDEGATHRARRSSPCPACVILPARNTRVPAVARISRH